MVRAVRAIVLVGTLVGTFTLVAGCGSSSKKATAPCVHNSECNSPLVCALGYCVAPCVTSRDCPGGQRCVTATTAPDGTPLGTACQAPEATTCKYNSQCEAPLICGVDGQCRNQCQSNEDCPGGFQSPPAQICTSVSHLCVDPTVDKNYNPVTNDLNLPDGGTLPAGGAGGGAQGGAGGGHGGAGGGRAGAGGGGRGGAGGGQTGYGGSVATCSVPATSFGTVVQGDANPGFTSAVAAANATTVFIFSSYSPSGTADAGLDGGMAGGKAIYEQELDPATGARLTSAAPLFQVPLAGDSFTIADAAIAPTGEMVILYLLRQGSSSTDTLYAAFLTTGAGADGGADGGVPHVHLARQPVLLESAPMGDPHVTWAAATSQFIVSWKYYSTTWFTHVRRFAVTGAGAGGDTSQVPTKDGLDNDPNYRDSAVGTSGSLLGVGLREYGNGHPLLSILDASGVQAGPLLDLGNFGVSAMTSGGTTKGFVVLSFNGATAFGVYVPISGSTGVLSDGGVPDGGVSSLFTTFTYGSNGSNAKAVSDDTGGQGGVGIAVLESNGASFLYVTDDGGKRYNSGTVLTSANSAWFGLTNFRGAFTLSLYDGAKHSAQAVVSGCP
jgi:hypothetical protein